MLSIFTTEPLLPAVPSRSFYSILVLNTTTAAAAAARRALLAFRSLAALSSWNLSRLGSVSPGIYYADPAPLVTGSVK
jgi:hypothetical protein